MGSRAVTVLCVVAATACSHDWTIVPLTDGDGGGVGTSTSSGMNGSSSSTSTTSSSSSSGEPPVVAELCETACSCGAGQKCSFRCTGPCTITCSDRATCDVEATEGCAVVNGGVAADCSSGKYTCKTVGNGKDVQCRKL